MSEDYVLTKLEQLEAIVQEIRSEVTKTPAKPSAELPFDMQKINWIDATDRNNRAYRLATMQNNINNEDFQKAKELLKSGGGTFRQKDGLSWLLFPDGDAIGVWDYKKR
jgi:hypothetical protein